MLGSPLKFTLVILLLFGGGAGALLAWVTRGEQRVVEKKQQEVISVEPEVVNCWVTVRSAHPMESVRIFKENAEVEVDQFSATEAETELPCLWGGDNVAELTFKVIIKWPEGTPETAALVKVEPEGQESRQKTLWAQGEITQEVTFTLDERVGEAISEGDGGAAR